MANCACLGRGELERNGGACEITIVIVTAGFAFLLNHGFAGSSCGGAGGGGGPWWWTEVGAVEAVVVVLVRTADGGQCDGSTCC